MEPKVTKIPLGHEEIIQTYIRRRRETFIGDYGKFVDANDYNFLELEVRCREIADKDAHELYDALLTAPELHPRVVCVIGRYEKQSFTVFAFEKKATRLSFDSLHRPLYSFLLKKNATLYIK
jgi:hypothetical protein